MNEFKNLLGISALALAVGGLLVPSSRTQAQPAAPSPAGEPGAPALSPESAARSAAPLATPATSLPAPAPVTAPPPVAEPTPASGPSLSIAPGRGITIRSADKNNELSLRSRIQLRTTLNKDDQRTTNETQVRTLRFTISGNVLVPELKYVIQLAFGGGDFEKDSASPIFDAFVECTKLRDLNVRVGQFFVPFDRARTIREFALQFVDRQGPVRELSLDRDLGIMLSSSDLLGLGGRLAYNVFVGSGDGRNRFADSTNPHGPQAPGVLLVGRLTLRPMGPFDDDQEGDLTRSPKPRLAVGVAGAYNISSDRDKSTYGNTYKLGTFNYTHAAADLVFKWHGFSTLAEVLYRDANKDTLTATVNNQVTTESARTGYGYFVQAGQMLTRMLELTARWDELKGTNNALKTVARASGRQVGGGLNLYVNGHAFKIQTDYFYAFGRELEKGTHIARLQLDATF